MGDFVDLTPAEEDDDRELWPVENPKIQEKVESNLVIHARRELERIDEEPETIEGYLKVIQAFADMGHSGGSASVAIPTIHRLLQFQNLSPLTNDPEEWMDVGDDIWQNVRNPEAFSNDGGKWFYLLSEGGDDQNRAPLHKAKDVRKKK